jgi:hypothetical protein
MRKPLQESIQQTVQKAWTDAVSSVMGLGEEMERRFQQAKERTDLTKGSEELQRVLAELGQRLQQNSEALEGRLEESVKTVIKRVRTPLMDEVAALRARAEQLDARIEQQIKRRGGDGNGTGTGNGEEPREPPVEP